MGREWIGRLDIAPDVERKIRETHGLTGQHVREAVQFDRYESATYNEATPYGPRLYVTGTSYDNVRLQAALAPVDRTDGHWELRTAVRRPIGEGWR